MDAHQDGSRATSGTPAARAARLVTGVPCGLIRAGSRVAGTPVQQLPPTWAAAAPRGGDVDTTFRWTIGSAKDARVELLPREFQLGLRREPGITGQPGRSAASTARGREVFLNPLTHD